MGNGAIPPFSPNQLKERTNSPKDRQGRELLIDFELQGRALSLLKETDSRIESLSEGFVPERGEEESICAQRWVLNKYARGRMP